MRNMHCGMKLILTSDIDFFFQITTIDDSIDNDPNYVEPTLDIEEKEDDDGDDDDGDNDDEVNQDDDFDDHEHDLDDDVGGSS